MGYTVSGRGFCRNCDCPIVQMILDADIHGDDDYAGVGWFHIQGPGAVRESCSAAGGFPVAEPYPRGG